MILTILFSILFLSADTGIAKASVPTAFKSVACDFFTHDNAMKVLGSQSIGTDGGMTENAEGRSWKCTFTPNDGGESSPRLYFMIMKSPSEEV